MWGVVLAITLVPGSPPAETDPVLSAAKSWIAQWRRTLPDFVCLQSSSEFVGGHNHVWHPTKEEQLELTVAGGREEYRVLRVNGRAPSRAAPSDFPTLSSKGEYASAMVLLFDPRSRTRFHRRGARHGPDGELRRYDFSIRQKNSHWYLGPDPGFAPAYEGSVWIDERDGSVRRLEMDAWQFPDSFYILEARLRAEIEAVTIGDAAYLLPHRASVRVCTKRGYCARRVLEFTGYRKFVAKSRLIR